MPSKLEIDRKILEKIINDMEINKSPGRDVITSFW